MDLNLATESTVIGDTEYTTTQFPAMRASVLLADLLKSFGSAIGVLAEIDPNMPLELAAPVLAGAFSSLRPEDVDVLIPKVLAGTTAMVSTGGRQVSLSLGSKANIDLVFSGRKLLDLFKVAWFAVRVNYRDFMPGSVSAAPGNNQAAVAG